MKGNNRFTFLVALLVVAVVLVAGTTYALFTKTVSGTKNITMKSGTRYVGIYGNNKENIGLNTTYSFTIENRGAEDASFNLYLEDITNSIGSNNIAYTYTKNGVAKTGILAEGKIDTDNIKVGEVIAVTISLSSNVTGDYKGIIKVSTGYLIEAQPNAPELRGDMIAVVYNDTVASWVKADITSEWYNYSDQQWANAVTIKDPKKRDEYSKAQAGAKISIEDINTMWVWIPRYSYTLGNIYGYQLNGGGDLSISTPGAFDIKFVTKDITDNGSGKYTTTTPENYYTPSSFCFGDTCDTSRSDAGNQELSGIWVSKFELTGSMEDFSSVPNAKSIDNQTIYAFFDAIQKQFIGDNAKLNYGFSGNYDLHMIKNSEWGAMAYLSQSKYGKYGNSSYTDANKEIYINNYNYLSSGCSAGLSTVAEDNDCKYTYNVLQNGTGASTTGNIYGIYDTVGGVSEYTMGNFGNLVSNSLFTAMPASRYYNLYTTKDGIKGDATNVDGTQGFYGDYQKFVDNSMPWMIRGGGMANSVEAGIFAFSSYTGEALPGVGTRMSLVAW